MRARSEPRCVLYLFDIDGTLLHAHRAGRDAFDAVFAEQHGVADASVGVRYGGRTDPAIVEEIFQARLGRSVTRAELDRFFAAYLPRLNARLAADGVEVIAGVLEALTALGQREDVALGVATGNIRAGADAKLSAGRLASWFRFGGFGCDSHLRAELVARAIERGRALTTHAAGASDVVVVGDTVHDIAAGRACHATVCAVTTGADSPDQLGDADAVFTSLAELPAWHTRRFG